MVIRMKHINMKSMKKLSITTTAVIAAAVMSLAGCGSSSSGSDSTASSSDSSAKTTKFVLGGLWPETGSLAYLAPPELAAEKLAVKDINDAGGVLGNDVTTVDADTSDADHADQNTSAAQSVLSKNPSFVIGPASSSVVKNTYKSITSQNVPMLSMGATSASFSGLSDYFFRTVAPDTVQGAVMGNLIAQDGVQKLAIAVFNDEYGTGLRDTVVKTAGDAGVDIVYGEKDTFDPTETNFSSIATAIKASNPDATLVIAFDQTKPLLKALASAGVDMSKLYFVDGNTSDYSSELDAGLLKGSKGTIPGVNPSDDFIKRLESTGVDLTMASFSQPSPRSRAAAPTARPSRPIWRRSPARTAAKSAIPTRHASPSSRTARTSSTKARPVSDRSTRTMIRAPRTSASTPSTATTSRSSTTPSPATFRPTDSRL